MSNPYIKVKPVKYINDEDIASENGIVDFNIPPADNDGPALIRKHIVEVLIGQYEMRENDAYDIADHWQWGRGRELRYFTLETYVEMFGVLWGPILYHYYHDMISEPIQKNEVTEITHVQVEVKETSVGRKCKWCLTAVEEKTDGW